MQRISHSTDREVKPLQSLRPIMLSIGVIVGNSFFLTLSADAQIIADDSLPTNSRVEQRDNRFLITEGTQRQGNLFHSFEAFSISVDEKVSFQNLDLSIDRIITRVTGASASSINGEISAFNRNGEVSNADLFLINPNGISYGTNASLNIGGSFITTTANSILFEDGTVFRTENLTPPLLTVSVPTGLQFGATVGNILNEAFKVDFDSDDFSIPISGGLKVSPERTLALIGGDITFDGGIAIAPNGRIEVGSVGPNSLVTLSQDSRGWTFGYDQVQQFQTLVVNFGALHAFGEEGGEIGLYGDQISIDNFSVVQVAMEGNGIGSGITIQGRHIQLDGSSLVRSNTNGNGRGGDINIVTHSLPPNSRGPEGHQIHINRQSIVRSSANGSGRGGDINIVANSPTPNSGNQDGHHIQIEGLVFSKTTGNGRGGSISVVANPPIVDSADQEGAHIQVDGSDGFVIAETTGNGPGGNIRVLADSLTLTNEGQIGTRTVNSGRGGNMTVAVSKVISISGGEPQRTSSFTPSSIFTTVGDLESGGDSATGQGGNMFIGADRILLTGGARIFTSTLARGRAGSLHVNASDIRLLGSVLASDGTLFFDPNDNLPVLSGFFATAESGSTGDGNDLTIHTDRLSVREGAVIRTGTFGAGQSGDLFINADEVEISGTDVANFAPSTIFAASGGLPPSTGLTEAGGSPNLRFFRDGNATGAGGTITINADELRVSDGGAIAVGALENSEAAGDLVVNARTVVLDEGRLVAETTATDGGNITFNDGRKPLVMTNNSLISTSGGAGESGRERRVILKLICRLYCVDALDENSDIRANAFIGRGGEY